jgi:superfamily I DNA/RNA helicase
MRELQIDDKFIQPRQVLGRISHAKNRMETPDKVGNGTYRDEQIAKIYDEYVKALARANALDFDDLLLKTVELFEHDGVRAKYQRQFRYVMVDEYQDTNRPQYMLIKHLVGNRHGFAKGLQRTPIETLREQSLVLQIEKIVWWREAGTTLGLQDQPALIRGELLHVDPTLGACPNQI